MKAAAFKARGAILIVGDALNPATVTQAASGAEHIISLVAVRRNRPQSFLEVNVDGPRILGQAAKAAGVQSVVLVSAIGARLDAHYKYFTSRWMGEQELAKTGIAGSILRFSFVLAEEGGVLNDFERAANFGPAMGNAATQAGGCGTVRLASDFDHSTSCLPFSTIAVTPR